MSWTDAEIERLTGLAREGRTAAQAAKALGRTRNAVLGKAHRIGLAFGPRKEAGPSGPHRRKPRRRRHGPPPQASEPAQATEPRQTVAPACPAPDGDYKPAPLLDLRKDQCRFPLWQPDDIDRKCCGAWRRFGDPYCEAHMKHTHTPIALARQKRRRDAGGMQIGHTSRTARWT